MADIKDPNDEGSQDDSALRDQLADSGYKPNADGMVWGKVQPKILVAGAFKVIRTAAEKARQITGKGR